MKFSAFERSVVRQKLSKHREDATRAVEAARVACLRYRDQSRSDLSIVLVAVCCAWELTVSVMTANIDLFWCAVSLFAVTVGWAEAITRRREVYIAGHDAGFPRWLCDELRAKGFGDSNECRTTDILAELAVNELVDVARGGRPSAGVFDRLLRAIEIEHENARRQYLESPGDRN